MVRLEKHRWFESRPSRSAEGSIEMKISYLFTFALLLSLASSGECQTVGQGNGEGFFGRWFERVDHALATQPHWLAPVFTPTARLEEMFVYDISHQNTAKGDLTSFGGTKGLLLIPAEHINIVTTPPSYITHESRTIHDGFGDASFLLKYRLVASNEERANYVVTAFLGATIPTGSYTNGARDAVVTPTIGLGKGRGNFDVQTTVGVGIPVGDVDRLGTPVLYNTAFQYRVIKKLWPELEVNATFFPNGPQAGNKQVFLSPGLMVGKFRLWRRLGFAMGGGIQIAATHFHTFNHNTVLTVRFPF
jgi:hypothetical protein